MGLSKTNLDESEESQNAGKDKQGYFSSFKRWLVKGTVAEPWPTAEELWEDPEVQKEIKKFEEAIKYLKNNQNQQG